MKKLKEIFKAIRLILKGVELKPTSFVDTLTRRLTKARQDVEMHKTHALTQKETGKGYRKQIWCMHDKIAKLELDMDELLSPQEANRASERMLRMVKARLEAPKEYHNVS